MMHHGASPPAAKLELLQHRLAAMTAAPTTTYRATPEKIRRTAEVLSDVTTE
jgi:hypothetical protein